MSRRILCKECGAKWKPHPQDVRDGWQYRAVHLVVKKPDDHSMTLITDDAITTSKLPDIYCDSCGDAVPNGSVALAVTMWRDGEIAEWEGGYGVVIPEQAAKVVKILDGGSK